jgi:hypothetical protein
LEGVENVAILHGKTREGRIWNERLAVSLSELESGAAALAARTAKLTERLDTHTRLLGLAPVDVRPLGYSRRKSVK